MDKQVSVNRQVGAAESLREDMLAVAAVVARAMPEVSEAIRSTADDPREELSAAIWSERVFLDCSDPVRVARDAVETRGFYPRGTYWEWHPNFLAECQDWSFGDQLEFFLELTGERCHELGCALVSIDTGGDNYELVVIPAADLAQRDQRTDRWLTAVRLGTWTGRTDPPADRNTVGPRTSMSEWDRFAEDLAAMVREGLCGDTVIQFDVPGKGVTAQVAESMFEVFTVSTHPFGLDDDIEVWHAEGWTLNEYDIWETSLANAKNVCDNVARRLADAFLSNGISSPTELTARIWSLADYNGELPMWRLDVPVICNR
ncbi:DUF6630 family protein [Nocardia sp. NPDC055321]